MQKVSQGLLSWLSAPCGFVKMCVFIHVKICVLSDFINLTHVHKFTVSEQDIFTFRRLSVFTVSFIRILQVLMQKMKRSVLYY